MNKNDKKKKKKPFAHNFLLSPEGRLLTTFDGYMMLVILYSCIMSAYYAAFSLPSMKILSFLEWVTLCSFSTDIIFNFMRMIQGPDGSYIKSHSVIAKNYLKTSLLFDLAATVPFDRIISDDFIIVKLLRLMRLPRVVRLFDLQRFKKLGTFISQG